MLCGPGQDAIEPHPLLRYINEHVRSILLLVIVVLAVRWLYGQAKSAQRYSMSRAEALEVLGLEEGATREEIQSAYRSLVKKLHPDLPGGSQYLTQQVNEAKHVLLDD